MMRAFVMVAVVLALIAGPENPERRGCWYCVNVFYDCVKNCLVEFPEGGEYGYCHDACWPEWERCKEQYCRLYLETGDDEWVAEMGL